MVQLAVLCFYKSTQKLPPFIEAAVVVYKNEKLVLLGRVQGSLVFRNSLGELVGAGSVVFALDAICDPVSLYEPVYHDGGEAIYVMDQVKDTKNTDENWLENIAISEAMKRLSDREKNILNMRFFEGKTQMEVADEIGISQAQVSRLEKSALKHMRKYV